MANAITTINLKLSDEDWVSIMDMVKERESAIEIEISRLVAEYLVKLRE